MRLSTRARYALRMMLDLAKHGDGGRPVSLADVAERTDCSRGYLEQLAATLRRQRLIHGVAGKGGGYRLTRGPSETTLREIIEASIGKISIIDCLEDDTTCMRTDVCECRLVYSLINARITQVLDDFTLADLLDPKLRLKVKLKLEKTREKESDA